jgi:hypothetical protein
MPSVELKNLLDRKHSKDYFVAFLNKNNNNFKQAIALVQTGEQPYAWRAAWVLCHAIKKQDKRILSYLLDIIKAIPNKKDGQQRELLKVVMKMEPLTEDAEGYFYDVCTNLWEDVNKQPAVRYYAGCYMITMAGKYPEIKNELEVLFGEYYTQSLSPGIKRIFERKLVKLNN